MPATERLISSAVFCATLLASPLIVGRSNAGENAAFVLPQAAPQIGEAVAERTTPKSETVEERIASLHAELKVTPDEASKWNDVAQAMRENALTVERLGAEVLTTPPQRASAVEDLRMY